jgi:hypothetical protein
VRDPGIQDRAFPIEHKIDPRLAFGRLRRYSMESGTTVRASIFVRSVAAYCASIVPAATRSGAAGASDSAS